MPSGQRVRRGARVISAAVAQDRSTETDGVLAQAEAAHGTGDLARAETLYRSILALDPDHARALHGLGVIALRTGHAGAAEGLLRRALALAPAMAEVYSNLGLALSGGGRGGEARAAFEQALSLRPDYAEAWSNLAILDQSEGEHDAAVVKFRRALAVNPTRAEIAANLGAALIETGEVEEGAAILQRLLPSLDRSAALHFNLGKARFLQGALPQAVEHLGRAVALEPGFADAHHTLGHALLASGRLTEGWREYDWRWRAKRFRTPPREFAPPRWTGGDPSGKRILVWSEQGVGDKLLFAGLLPELAAVAAEVTVEIEDRLVPLFRRSFPACRIVPRRDPPDECLTLGQFDLQVPLGDLPRYFRPTLDGFRPLGPYLAADPERREMLRRRYADGRKPLIGIAWASRPPKGVPLAAFASLFACPEVRWVSLQYGDPRCEIEAANRAFGIEIFEDRDIDALADFDGSVAQTAALDAVVTIQNATLYTAAGLELPTFALTPPEPDWRWLGCAQSPWHETVRLYRQDREGADTALARLAADVKRWLDTVAR